MAFNKFDFTFYHVLEVLNTVLGALPGFVVPHVGAVEGQIDFGGARLFVCRFPDTGENLVFQGFFGGRASVWIEGQ